MDEYSTKVLRKQIEQLARDLRNYQVEARDLEARLSGIDAKRLGQATAIYNLCRTLGDPFPENAVGEKITKENGHVRYIVGLHAIAAGPDSEPAKSTQPSDADEIRIDPDVMWDYADVGGRRIGWFDAEAFPTVLALEDDGTLAPAGQINGVPINLNDGYPKVVEMIEAADIIVGKASVYHAQKQLEIDDAKKDARLTPSSDDSLHDMMQQSMDVLDALIRDVRTLQGRAGAQDQQIVAMGHQIATLFNQDAALDEKITGTHKGAEQRADKPFGLSPIEEAALRWDYQKSPSGRTGADALFTDVIRSQIDANTRIARHQERIRRELNRSPLDDAEQRARDVTDPARRPAT